MGKQRRWVELGKDLLIVLLAAGAVVLIYFSPLVQGSGLLELFSKGNAEGALRVVPPQARSAAAIPLRMTAGTGLGLYGAQYDQAAVDALFDTAGPLLGEALEAAGQPQALAEVSPEGGGLSWRAMLGRDHIYFGYAEPVPLSALYAWLKPEGSGTALDGSARHILLSAMPDGSLALCYRGQEGGFYLCGTGLDASLHLPPVLDQLTPNSAYFAFEDQSLPSVLDPYTLITSQEAHAPVYRGVNPVAPADTAQISQLLSALSFSDLNQASASDGSVYFVDGDDTLRLYASGMVRCHAGQGRYEAAPGLSGAVEAAWSLAGAAVGPLCGAARLYLVSAVEEGDGAYTVTFGYSLNGSTVQLPDQNWCVQAVVREQSVTDLTLFLRAYSASGQEDLLLPAGSAAAALTALTTQKREMTVQYVDDGELARPRWFAR